MVGGYTFLPSFPFDNRKGRERSSIILLISPKEGKGEIGSQKKRKKKRKSVEG